MPASTPSPYFAAEVRQQPLDRRLLAQLVAQQPSAVVGDDELDVNAAREQRRQRPRRVDRAARAGDRDGDRRRRRPLSGHRCDDREHEQIQDADVAVQVERALHLRQIVGADERLLVHEQRRHARRRRRR